MITFIFILLIGWATTPLINRLCGYSEGPSAGRKSVDLGLTKEQKLWEENKRALEILNKINSK